MKFERLTNELYGARNAGYKVDTSVPMGKDADLVERAMYDRGENFIDNLIDSLCDFDGDLYRGSDGNMYAVEFIWEDCVPLPAVWKRLKH